MNRNICLSVLISTFALYLCNTPVVLSQHTYYISPDGSDSADGLSPANAWKTIAKVNATQLSSGDQVLFQRGGVWREHLSISSNGSQDAPIIFGSYGEGSRPTIYGSDVLDGSGFQKVAGTVSTYKLTTAPVRSVLSDGHFYRSAFLANNQINNDSVNLEFVNDNPGTWHYAAGELYINTGGSDPRTDGNTYTGTRREGVLIELAQNIVIRDLVVRETAAYNAGYGFRLNRTTNVRIENSEVHAAGKHHFGVLNSTGFVGERLFASGAMPDQGIGGASAYVAFSSGNYGTNDTYVFRDVAYVETDTNYSAFVTHGSGVGEVTLENMVSRGVGYGINNLQNNAKIVIKGGLVENGILRVYGNDTVIDGIRLAGSTAAIDLIGNRNLVQNIIVQNSTDSAIRIEGNDNVVRYSTIVTSPQSPNTTIFTIASSDSATHVYGNIFNSSGYVIKTDFLGTATIDLKGNLFRSEPTVLLPDGTVIAMADWLVGGLDSWSRIGDPAFVDLAVNDFHLTRDSAAIAMIPFHSGIDAPILDHDGYSRWKREGYDVGAYVYRAVPEPVGIVFLLIGILAMGRPPHGPPHPQGHGDFRCRTAAGI